MAGKDKKFSESFLDGELDELCYIEQIEYQPEDGGEPLFMEPPEDNLLFVLQTINSKVRFQDKDKNQIWQSIKIAERVIGSGTLPDRDIALASVFFDLGLAFGQGLIHSHKLEQEYQDTEGNRVGGGKSPYQEHKPFITKCILGHIKNKKSYKSTLNLIEGTIHERPSESSLYAWKQKVKKGLPIF